MTVAGRHSRLFFFFSLLMIRHCSNAAFDRNINSVRLYLRPLFGTSSWYTLVWVVFVMYSLFVFS